jgi:YtkA-like
MIRTIGRLVALATLAILALLALAAPAAAHEGDGIITFEAQEPAGPAAVHYVVRLTWENDGHAALDATFTVTPVQPDGTTLTPVPLTPLDQDGRYEATVTFPAPGAWTVRFTAVKPKVTSELPQQVDPPPTTTAATTVTVDETTTTELAVSTASDNQSGDDDGSPVGWMAAGVVLVVAGVGGAVGLARHNRQPAEG